MPGILGTPPTAWAGVASVYVETHPWADCSATELTQHLAAAGLGRVPGNHPAVLVLSRRGPLTSVNPMDARRRRHTSVIPSRVTSSYRARSIARVSVTEETAVAGIHGHWVVEARGHEDQLRLLPACTVDGFPELGLPIEGVLMEVAAAEIHRSGDKGRVAVLRVAAEDRIGHTSHVGEETNASGFERRPGRAHRCGRPGSCG